MQRLGRAGLAILGWRIEGNLPDLPKLVIIVAPHTSNWDFFVGLFVDLALDLEAHWWGKHTLFRWPVAGWLRAVGGIPVERSASQNAVATTIDAFARAERFVFALAPEGTRKKAERWRTGFHHVARGANVPIVMAALDYGRRVFVLSEPVCPTADVEGDIARMRAWFTQFPGKYPDQF
jgi:1-acyl-sn-glycerol-3-phosphate acyltransferase